MCYYKGSKETTDTDQVMTYSPLYCAGALICDRSDFEDARFLMTVCISMTPHWQRQSGHVLPYQREMRIGLLLIGLSLSSSGLSSPTRGVGLFSTEEWRPQPARGYHTGERPLTRGWGQLEATLGMFDRKNPYWCNILQILISCKISLLMVVLAILGHVRPSGYRTICDKYRQMGYPWKELWRCSSAMLPRWLFLDIFPTKSPP